MQMKRAKEKTWMSSAKEKKIDEQVKLCQRKLNPFPSTHRSLSFHTQTGIVSIFFTLHHSASGNEKCNLAVVHPSICSRFRVACHSLINHSLFGNIIVSRPARQSSQMQPQFHFNSCPHPFILSLSLSLIPHRSWLVS